MAIYAVLLSSYRSNILSNEPRPIYITASRRAKQSWPGGNPAERVVWNAGGTDVVTGGWGLSLAITAKLLPSLTRVFRWGVMVRRPGACGEAPGLSPSWLAARRTGVASGHCPWR